MGRDMVTRGMQSMVCCAVLVGIEVVFGSIVYEEGL